MTGTSGDNGRMRPAARRALYIGLGAGVLCAVFALVWPASFYPGYLLGCLLWLGVPLGSMAILMVHHLVGGTWGLLIRRPLEAATRTLPLMVLLFVPFLWGTGYLYPWAHPEWVRSDRLLQHKQAYLNTPFFLGRMGGYFVIWLVLTWLLNRWSARQDATADAKYLQRMRQISGPGLILYGLTMTYAAIDWVMSMQPHFYSSIYGLIFVTGQPLSALALALIVLTRLAREAPLRDIVRSQGLRDLGNLTLAFTMLWAYMSFSQFLLVWMGNLPHEAAWYVDRLRSGWAWIGLSLIVIHFGLPFALLLSRATKSSLAGLRKVAIILLVMRGVDLFWLIGPRVLPVAPGATAEGSSTVGIGGALTVVSLLAPVAVGGVWTAVYLWQLSRRPLLPIGDERMKDLPAAAHGVV